MWKTKKSFEKELDSFISTDQKEEEEKEPEDVNRVSEEACEISSEVSSVVIPIQSVNFKKLKKERKEEEK